MYIVMYVFFLFLQDDVNSVFIKYSVCPGIVVWFSRLNQLGYNN